MSPLAPAAPLALSLPEPIRAFVYRNLDLFTLSSENTILHLVIALVAFHIYFLGRLYLERRAIEHARAAIPIHLGGWGTRGKSGTERKKAALFAALGMDVFSKTTGCEAMFIHSPPLGEPLELFLFRPYDKATIWEQRNCVVTGAQLGTQVFLWECMALNPSYVYILSNEWMQDPIVTLTNTYPDHEDIQGPAGIDLPRVMCKFMPRGSTVFTAEDQHLPILRDGAKDHGCKLFNVVARDGDLIPQDLLDRYPYKVHPMNLALVVRMAQHMGIEPHFAFKEIADTIVPDLGVLKIFPRASHLGREMEFANGHSANEKRGMLGNWVRCGFDKNDPDAEPVTYLVTVINNRADRIARSKVFAGVMMKDVNLHAHMCIGTNLNGMRGYCNDSLKERLDNVSLVRPDDEKLAPADRTRVVKERLDKEIHDIFPEVDTEERLRRKVLAMLSRLGVPDEEAKEAWIGSGLEAAAKTATEVGDPNWEVVDAQASGKTNDAFERLLPRLGDAVKAHFPEAEVGDHLVAWVRRYVHRFHSIRRLRAHADAALASGNIASGGELTAKTRELVHKAMLEKVVLLPDPSSKGDGVVDWICRNCPPGHLVRVMGSQNIKNTGLDWVYRWVSVDKIAAHLKRLDDERHWVRLNAVQALGAHGDYGILDTPIALAGLKKAKERADNQDLAMQTAIDAAIRYVEEKMKQKRAALVRKAPTGGRFSRAAAAIGDWLLKNLETFLDSADARRRRIRADDVVRDLVAQRVSHERAAVEFRELTYRQKGGWLKKDIAKRIEKLRATFAAGGG